jgi:hypothetical protein
MKSIQNIIFAFVFLFAMPALASNPAKNVSSKITDVTIYREFAKVTNLATIIVQPGTTEIVLDNISTNINPQSLQVAIKGGMTLLSAVYNVNYLNLEIVLNIRETSLVFLHKDYQKLTESLHLVLGLISDCTSYTE